MDALSRDVKLKNEDEESNGRGWRKKQGQEIRGRGEGLGVTRLGRTTIQSQE